jgi:large conductance mechanosensitive channel
MVLNFAPLFTNKLWRAVVLKEFKEFIMGGNLIDLAVAVLLAGAIGKVVSAFTDDIVGGIIAKIFRKPNFDELVASGINYGRFITALINLVIVGAVLFAIVKAYKKMRAGAPPAPPSSTDALLMEIRDSLKR